MLVAPVDYEVVRLDLLPAGAGELGLEPAGCEQGEVVLVEEAGRGHVPAPGEQLGGEVEVRDVGDADDQRRTRVPVGHVGQCGEELTRAGQSLDHPEGCDGREPATGEDLLEALGEPVALAEVHECRGEPLSSKILEATRLGVDPEVLEAELRA